MRPMRIDIEHVGSPRLRLTVAYAAILVFLLGAFSLVVWILLRMLILQEVGPYLDDPSMVLAANAMLKSYGLRLLIVDAVGIVIMLGAAIVLAKVTLRPLEQAIALQQQFTNDASHDLRTPLAVIRTETTAALGSDQPLSTASFERLTIIDQQVQRMERLIDQLLTLSHVDAGSALEREPADLAAVVNGTVRDLLPLAQARSISLELDRCESAVVLGDKLKLSQIVGNLVDNAIKYSPDGTPISIEVWQNRDAAFLTVSDRGIGIAADDMERIFLRFHRADRTGQGRPGHGLGLPLCRWIARAHGGEVTVDSREGEGSVFTVRLPALTV
jgi:signal transduction histidine kinase